MQTIKNFSRLVKFEHTIFALPFALIGFFLAETQTDKEFNWLILVLVLFCMVFARNAAMGFNRYLDRQFDQLNPRTAGREIPAGIIKPRHAIIFVIINSGLFIVTTWFINSLCFFLSPVALFIILFYSYTKRITALCHFVLSLGLALAPVGAYLAVAGKFDWIPVIIGMIVFFWVSGFDIIYALQDEEFDKDNKLKSIPSFIGKKSALNLSIVIHAFTAVFIILTAVKSNGGIMHWIGAGVFIILLIYQHSIIKHDDLRKVNLAFFTTNGIASIIYGASVIGDMFIN